MKTHRHTILSYVHSDPVWREHLGPMEDAGPQDMEIEGRGPYVTTATAYPSLHDLPGRLHYLF